MIHHVGGGYYSGGKLNATVILFTILASNGNYCQLRCPAGKAGYWICLFEAKAKNWGLEYEVSDNFIYIGKGRIEICEPKKLLGDTGRIIEEEANGM